MRTKFRLFILLWFGLGTLFSCREKQEYPPEPYLEYIDFLIFRHPAGYDSLGILRLFYTDGDGDLGMFHWDTTSFNFFVAYYKMQNGVLLPGTRYNPITGKFDTIYFNNRIYKLAPDDYIGWIKGEIEDTIRPLYDPRSTRPYDTISFKAWIFDRAGNKSNVVETPLIVVKNPV